MLNCFVIFVNRECYLGVFYCKLKEFGLSWGKVMKEIVIYFFFVVIVIDFCWKVCNKVVFFNYFVEDIMVVFNYSFEIVLKIV